MNPVKGAGREAEWCGCSLPALFFEFVTRSYCGRPGVSEGQGSIPAELSMVSPELERLHKAKPRKLRRHDLDERRVCGLDSPVRLGLLSCVSRWEGDRSRRGTPESFAENSVDEKGLF